MLQFEVFDNTGQLPGDWDIPAGANVFLTRKYLDGLAKSAPTNMLLHFIMIRADGRPVAVALSQFLDMSRVRSFGERDNCLKTKIRTFAFRRVASNVLLLGNNMLTGQNAFGTVPGTDLKAIVATLENSLLEIRDRLKDLRKNPHLTIWKDFPASMMTIFDQAGFGGYYRFSTQPNMVFAIPEKWNSESDYVAALHKKYRDQYKRARKKAAGLIKRQLSQDDIHIFQDQIDALYHCVAANAPFNTFYLHRDHFEAMKQALGDDFRVYGYFDSGKLVGFNTIISNGRDIDTYFLGYDENARSERMLYLNMLYDMIGYSIKNGYERIIFARTALEIKSSVGAVAEPVFGLIKHRNSLINGQLHRIFGYFEPELKWKPRHPFKDGERQASSAAEESRFRAC